MSKVEGGISQTISSCGQCPKWKHVRREIATVSIFMAPTWFQKPVAKKSPPSDPNPFAYFEHHRNGLTVFKSKGQYWETEQTKCKFGFVSYAIVLCFFLGCMEIIQNVLTKRSLVPQYSHVLALKYSIDSFEGAPLNERFLQLQLERLTALFT